LIPFSFQVFANPRKIASDFADIGPRIASEQTIPWSPLVVFAMPSLACPAIFCPSFPDNDRDILARTLQGEAQCHLWTPQAHRFILATCEKFGTVE
jgi:hypothetical protein